LNQFRSVELWRSTIMRMKEEHGADLSRAEVDLLVDFHVQRQQREAVIFADKCQQCHSGERYLEKELTPDQARDIIRRMQQKAGNRIEDHEVEIIVRYHALAQQSALEKSLQGVSRTIDREQPLMMRGRALFSTDCLTCHQISRTLSYGNDAKIWERTVETLQQFSNDTITTRQIDQLADVHIEQQKKAIGAFKNTCTRCHDERRINQRNMSEEQWQETIRRMQQKAPDLFSEDKVSLIAAYFHRRELALARTFSGSCLDCHANEPANSSSGLVSKVTDQDLIAVHADRQRRNMQIFNSKCFTCHPGGSSEKQVVSAENASRRTQKEWIAFIADLQGEVVNAAVEEEIDHQIEFHKYIH